MKQFTQYWYVVLAILIVYSATLLRTMESEDIEIDFLRDVGMPAGMPLIEGYHMVRQHPLLNMELPEANLLVKLGDLFLTPTRYLFGGKTVKGLDGPPEDVEVRQQFNYQTKFKTKLFLSAITFPVGMTLGAPLKQLGLFLPGASVQYRKLKEYLHGFALTSNLELYRSVGLSEFYSDEEAPPSLGMERPENTAEIHKPELDALRLIVDLLNEHEIVFWADCGTALGTYRYNGFIPWDHDIDLSIFQPDHDNVMRILRQLPEDKYVVQDWSSYLFPKTFIKVYIKEIKSHIDIYHYQINPNDQTIEYIHTFKHSPLPRGAKLGERVMTTPLKYADVFPLRRGQFDEIAVWVPNRLVIFLQSKYGDNLTPSKVWNEHSGRYEKVKGHPYWEVPKCGRER